MSTSEPEETGKTAPIEVSPPAAPAAPAAVTEPAPVDEAVAAPAVDVAPTAMPPEPVAPVARVATAQEREVVYVPLSVSIGDGFKFGCGFFLALVIAMLVGFVLLAALFALTSIFGLNLPLGR